MKVLVACEFSGVVRDAFRQRGHDAWSCDLLPTDEPSAYHHQGDVLDIVGPGFYGGWDLLIAHPPCTYLANSGVKHLYKGGRKALGRDPQRWRDLDEAVKFFGLLWSSTIPKVCIENPIHHLHARQRIGFEPTQYVQPWHFGHKEMKATGLWLRGLPPLRPTHVVGPPPKEAELRKHWARVHRESPGPDRWKRRSITYQGIAEAMADQWGSLRA